MKLNDVLANGISYAGSFINGGWVAVGHAHGSFQNPSPANLDWILPKVDFTYEHVELAVEAAGKAFQSWKYVPLEERVGLMSRWVEEIKKRQDHMARLVALETGKPFDEALTEVAGLVSKIDVTIQHGLKLLKTETYDFGEALGRGEIHWRPKGVLAVIGPFNFPVHLSHGHIVPALLTGNVCILKPSERTPLCAQVYMESFAAAGFPAGVLQLVHGDGASAVKLIRHVGVHGVLATCSYEIGCKIQKELAEKPRKLVALEMGGKNAALVWDNVDLEKVANDLIRSSFLTTGQRCSALSRTYVKRELLNELVAKVHEKTKDLVIQHPFALNPRPFMGPLVSAKSMENFLRYSKIGEHEGESIMRPKQLEKSSKLSQDVLPKGYYVTPSINLVKAFDPQSSYQNHEIFAPDMFFCPIDSLEEGIQAVNSNPYGLSFSFFGADEKTFDHVADRINAGVLYWNKPTVGASGRLPFGGWGRSGNHRPAGLFAIYASNQVQSRSKPL